MLVKKGEGHGQGGDGGAGAHTDDERGDITGEGDLGFNAMATGYNVHFTMTQGCLGASQRV